MADTRFSSATNVYHPSDGLIGAEKNGPTGRSEMLDRIKELIPLGAQTFSKSYLQWPIPLILDRGQGARVWDTNGKEYLDYVGGLLPIILGYRDPEVDQAIIAQLGKGISFSFPTPLELELAELLHRLIPSAEMVRFGKNGSDVTTAAVRLARYHTGRELIIYTGYHGWHDWSIRHKTINGIPRQHSIYSEWIDNDVANGAAAVVVEGGNTPEYLKVVRDSCDKWGSVMILDEIITGFRINMGGAQKEYGITPDLSTFGKAMGNGMPISALVGKREIMKKLEDVFFSGTFMGECLSLAAAIACIKKMERDNVTQRLKAIGNWLKDLPGVSGPDWRPKIEVKNQSLWRQEAIKSGLIAGTHFNLMLAHDNTDVMSDTAIRYCGTIVNMKTAVLTGPEMRAAVR